MKEERGTATRTSLLGSAIVGLARANGVVGMIGRAPTVGTTEGIGHVVGRLLLYAGSLFGKPGRSVFWNEGRQECKLLDGSGGFLFGGFLLLSP
jgi:hypothetical protein